MTFISALLLGLLASAHCAGMCGGLQSALQQPLVIRSSSEAHRHLLVLNLGRLSVYTLAGVIFSTLGASLLTVIDVPQVSRIARILSAVVLLMIGFQLLLSNSKPFVWIESVGAALWSRVSAALPSADSNKLSRSYYRGLIWGFLPCGLVYGALLTTIFTNSSLQGGATMLGFGLGTLPAMVLTGGLYQYVRKTVRNRGVQLVGGLIFIQGGILMIVAPWFVSTDFMRAYPQLMSSMFCLS